MRHNWIIDVLADLEAYASQNDLPGVARKVEEAMAELRREADLLRHGASVGPPVPRGRVN